MNSGGHRVLQCFTMFYAYYIHIVVLFLKDHERSLPLSLLDVPPKILIFHHGTASTLQTNAPTHCALSLALIRELLRSNLRTCCRCSLPCGNSGRRDGGPISPMQHERDNVHRRPLPGPAGRHPIQRLQCLPVHLAW